MSDASLITLTLNKQSATPLFQQIYDALKARVISGALEAGYRLPSSRSFASELGVSRSSILAAYDQLSAEGYIEGRSRTGIYVSDLPDLNITQKVSEKSIRSNKRNPQDISEVKDPVPFAPGLPDMRLFPYVKWGRCISRVARLYPEQFVISNDNFGNIDLREAICQHLSEWRGIKATPEQIIITSGASGALDLITNTLAKADDLIALENPGYRVINNYVLKIGAKPVWLGVDEHGARISSLKKRKHVKLIILTPSHQFPLGGTMPTARRAEFLNYAEQEKSWLIEDDFDSEFRYSGRPIPALASMDQTGRVLYVGSFAKIFSTSLRVGYLVIPNQLIETFRTTLNLYRTSASTMPQYALAEFMKTGEFHKHIRRMRRIYAGRRKHFIELLETELKNSINFEDHGAGMQIAINLNKNINDIDLSKKAQKLGIQCPALSEFYTQSQQSGLLLGFCAFQEDEMFKPMKKLKQILK